MAGNNEYRQRPSSLFAISKQVFPRLVSLARSIVSRGSPAGSPGPTMPNFVARQNYAAPTCHADSRERRPKGDIALVASPLDTCSIKSARC
jgi:hypothetical protein